MHNLFVLTLLLLAGCATPSTSPSGASTHATIRNERCLESPRIRVFQVLDHGILANLCPTSFKSYYDDAFDACNADGDTVYMPVKPAQNDYVDDQKVTLPDEKCFVADGTFSYVTAKDMNKRVRKIKIIDAQTPSPSVGAEKKK